MGPGTLRSAVLMRREGGPDPPFPIYINVCVCVCVYIYTYTYIHIYIYILLYIVLMRREGGPDPPFPIYICMCVCIYIYISYTDINIYIYKRISYTKFTIESAVENEETLAHCSTFSRHRFSVTISNTLATH